MVEPPFVGRADEIERACASIRSSPSRTLALLGPPGIGKSAALEMVARRLHAEGLDVERVVGAPAGVDLPLAPFCRFLDQPSVDQPGAGVPDRSELVRRVVNALRARARESELVLLVDDANDLDDASSVVVRQLAHSGEFTVVVAARSTDTLSVELGRLVDHHATEVIELGPLDRAATDQLVRLELARMEVLASPDAPESVVRPAVVSDEVIEEVWRWSGGVPFHARDLVAAAVQSGALDRAEDGAWLRRGPLSPSGRFSDALGRRVEQLGPECERLVRVLAVTGPLSFAVADHLATPEQRLAAERADILRRPAEEAGFEPVDFAHDLYREAVAGWLSAAQRRRLAADTAALIGELESPGPEEVMLRAELSLAAGELGTDDPDVFERGAEVACRHSYDGERALRLAEAALARGASWESDLLRVEALGLLRRLDDASEGFAELDSTLEDPGATAAVSVAHAWHLLLEVGDAESAVELLAAAVRRAPPDLVEELRGQQLTALVFLGRYADAVRAGEDCLTLGSDMPLSMAFGLATALSVTGRPADALRVADALLRDSMSAGHDADTTLVRINLVWNRLLASWQLGTLGELACPFDGLSPPDSPLLGSAWATASMRAAFDILRGRLDAACAGYESVWPRMLAGPTQVVAFNSVLRAMGEAQLGHPDRARLLIGHLDELPPGATRAFPWWVERARALVLAAEGRVAEAVRGSLELIDRHPDEHFHVTTSLHDIVRLGRATAVRDRLDEQASRPGATWWDVVCADHAAAAVEGDVAALVDVADRFEQGGRAVDAYEALAQAVIRGSDVRATPEVKVLGAGAHVRLDELRRVCGRVATPSTSAPAQLLTERERLVALLAGSGLSNGAIAERLGTSVRTVGNQLQQVYQKLGVHSRKELRSLVD